MNQYPLGPQLLCCGGQSGSRATDRLERAEPSPHPPATSPRRGAGGLRPSRRPRRASGGRAALLIGFGALAVLLVTGAAAVVPDTRRPRPCPRHSGSRLCAATAASNGVAPAASLGTATPRLVRGRRGTARPLRPSRVRGPRREFRRLDANGDAGGAFNLGVVLHQRGDVEGATAAYERAEERGDPDAAFNLGVLLYEAGDLDGAEACWQRSAGRGHVRAAANLLFLSRRRRAVAAHGIARPSPRCRGLAEFEELSYRRADEGGAATGAFNLGAMLHQQGETAGALAAYERAERRGDPDAAFNLGVLLYETGDLDGAEAAWRRSAERGAR